MRSPSAAISLALILVGGTACRVSEPGPSAQAQAQAQAKTQANPAPSDAAGSNPAPQLPPDPARADKLRDLDDLCKSVDHDYADGTLGDYYSGLKLRTAWGEAQRQVGVESIQPGRALEQATLELSVSASDPMLGHCSKLFDYLDDVE